MALDQDLSPRGVGDDAANARRTAGSLVRSAALIAVFLFTLATMLVLAIAAPIALSLSALFRALAPARRRGRWRIAAA